MLLDSARRIEAPTPAMQSRRSILEWLLRPQVVPVFSSGGEWFPFLHVDASKHKYSQAKVVHGYSVAGSEDATRCPDPLQWLRFGQLGRKVPDSPWLSFVFLEWGYKIRECKPRGKYSSCEGSNFNDDWKRLPSLGGATPAQDPRADRAKRTDHRARTGRAVLRLVGHGAGGLGCPVLTGHGSSISRRRSSEVGSESGLAL